MLIKRAVSNRNYFKLLRRSSRSMSKLSLSEKKRYDEYTEITTYLKTTLEYQIIKDNLPKMLLRKYKYPESMYLINKSIAKDIANTVKLHLHDDDCPIIEVNPGFCFLSRELLNCLPNNLYLYETSNLFSHYFTLLNIEYPNRVIYKISDFFGMWKLAFQDKMDQGNRIKELLGTLATEDNDRVVKIIGSMPGLSFVKHLLYNILFHSTTNQLGRPDMFITMPGHHYMFLADDQIELKKHRSLPALFQLLFDFKILKKFSKVHFLPWTNPPTKRAITMDEDCLYLVNITQKEELPCPPEYLPLLWYFFRPHMLSNPTRVIPKLEQWIPGCGVWLITGQDPPDTNIKLLPSDEDAKLPHMTIFTEFGDLSLQQKLTVFKRLEFYQHIRPVFINATRTYYALQNEDTMKADIKFEKRSLTPTGLRYSDFKFIKWNHSMKFKIAPFISQFTRFQFIYYRFISWPEFDQCQFRVTMENNLPKMVTAAEDDDKSSIATPLEDIDGSESDTECES